MPKTHHRKIGKIFPVSEIKFLVQDHNSGTMRSLVCWFIVRDQDGLFRHFTPRVMTDCQRPSVDKRVFTGHYHSIVLRAVTRWVALTINICYALKGNGEYQRDFFLLRQRDVLDRPDFGMNLAYLCNGCDYKLYRAQSPQSIERDM